MGILINDASVNYDVTEVRDAAAWIEYEQNLRATKGEEVETAGLPAKYPCLVIAERTVRYEDDNGTGSRAFIDCMFFYDYTWKR